MRSSTSVAPGWEITSRLGVTEPLTVVTLGGHWRGVGVFNFKMLKAEQGDTMFYQGFGCGFFFNGDFD